MYSNTYDANGNWTGYGAYRDQQKIDMSNVKLSDLDPKSGAAQFTKNEMSKPINPEKTDSIVEDAIKQIEILNANGDIYDRTALTPKAREKLTRNDPNAKPTSADQLHQKMGEMGLTERASVANDANTEYNNPIERASVKGPKSSYINYNEQRNGLEPKTQSDIQAFNRQFSDKTRGIKPGDHRRVLITAGSHVYLVDAEGYMNGVIQDRIPIAGNEERLHDLREELRNGFNRAGEAIDNASEGDENPRGRYAGDNALRGPARDSEGIGDVNSEEPDDYDIGSAGDYYGYETEDQLRDAIESGALIIDDDYNILHMENPDARTDNGGGRFALDERASVADEKNRDFNNKQTEVGSNLKTLQGTTIKRYKNNVGKEVGSQVYLHKNYADQVVPQDALAKAEAVLREKHPDFSYNTIMYDITPRSARAAARRAR